MEREFELCQKELDMLLHKKKLLDLKVNISEEELDKLYSEIISCARSLKQYTNLLSNNEKGMEFKNKRDEIEFRNEKIRLSRIENEKWDNIRENLPSEWQKVFEKEVLFTNNLEVAQNNEDTEKLIYLKRLQTILKKETNNLTLKIEELVKKEREKADIIKLWNQVIIDEEDIITNDRELELQQEWLFLTSYLKTDNLNEKTKVTSANKDLYNNFEKTTEMLFWKEFSKIQIDEDQAVEDILTVIDEAINLIDFYRNILIKSGVYKKLIKKWDKLETRIKDIKNKVLEIREIEFNKKAIEKQKDEKEQHIKINQNKIEKILSTTKVPNQNLYF